ncbi:MAG: MFS transporter [Mycobacterium leprae]
MAELVAANGDEQKESIWRQRDFMITWGGQAVSMQGDGLEGVAMNWWIMQVLGSASAAVLVQLAGFLPGILLAPLAGAVADRVDRKRLLMSVDTIRGVITGVVAWAMASGRLNLVWVLVATVLMVSVGVFHGPALEASVSLLVPASLLNRANGLTQMASSSAQIIAPIAGGVVVAALGPGAAVTLNSISFFLAALTLLWVVIPRPAAAENPATGAEGGRKESIWRDMGGGFRYLRQGEPMLFFMLLFAALVNFALVPMGPLLPFMATRRLGLGAGGYGTMVIALPMGALAGSTLASRFGNRIRRGQGVIWGIVTIGGCVALFAASRNLPMAMSSLFLIGVGMAVANISSTGIFQTRVPQSMQGRVFAIRRAMALMASPVALLLTAGLAQRVPVHWIIGVGGLVAGVSGLGGYLVPGLSRAD